MAISVAVKLKPWTVPNFASVEMPVKPREEGLQNGVSFALNELPAEALAQLCDEFRAEVFRKAGKPDPSAPSPNTEARDG